MAPLSVWSVRQGFRLYVKVLGLAALLLASSGPATAQVAILQIQVIEGEGAVHPPGSRSSRPLTVEITDETGQPVAGAAVSFHLPEDGPSGTFLNGLRTAVATTDSRGRADLRGLQVNRTPGKFQIRIVVSKEQARAGAVSGQYIAELQGGAASTPAARAVHGRAKWIALAALAGGGAIAATILGGGRAGSTTGSPATVVAPTLTVGAPSVSVGKP
jgi:hypothetical protein